MQILLLNNGTTFLDELASLLGNFGQVTITESPQDLGTSPANLIVLSGGHHHSILSDPSLYQAQVDFIRQSFVPIIGICLGAELIAHTFGAKLVQLDTEQTGIKDIQILKKDPIFSDIPNLQVYEHHRWAITEIPDTLEAFARSETGIEIFKHQTRPFYGFQFHPEMCADKTCGDEIFSNLLKQLTTIDSSTHIH